VLKIKTFKLLKPGRSVILGFAACWINTTMGIHLYETSGSGVSAFSQKFKKKSF
jgi:hypothetical protein